MKETRGAAFCLVMAVLAGGSPAAQSHPDRAVLRKELSAVLSAPILARSHWGILVKSLDRGDIVFEENAGKLVLPASNMKVVTMAVATSRLGWDYRFETTLESAAPIVNGVLQGDLVIRGAGDPTIGSQDDHEITTFEDWATQLQSAGIETIDGRIVGDDDAFDEEEIGNGWSWDDLAYAYAAPVGALTFNESLVTVSAYPGRAVGRPAILQITPPEHGFRVVNRAVTSAAGRPETIDVRRTRGSFDLEVTGTVPLGSLRAGTANAAVENPTVFFARALRAALIARGIEVKGGAVDRDALVAEDPARQAVSTRVLARHRSPALAEIGRRFMKVSQNLYGEALVKTLGKSAGQGSTIRGQQVIRETLDAWGIPGDSYILADGSGLSRMNFVSAEALAKILEHVHASARDRDLFLAALPIGGQDGTLRNRLKAAWTAGQVHAKTGSIANTRALSGYVTTRGGETLVFSIIANNFSLPAWRIERVIDLMVEIIAR